MGIWAAAHQGEEVGNLGVKFLVVRAPSRPRQSQERLEQWHCLDCCPSWGCHALLFCHSEPWTLFCRWCLYGLFC